MTCYYDMWEGKDGHYTAQEAVRGTHNTYLMNMKAELALENHPKTEPMFMYISYPNAHLPLQVLDTPWS